MSRESEIAALLLADATLVATLTGGIYVGGALGVEGITRETVTAAFGTTGYLKPCALVKQRTRVTLDVLDYDAQIESARQMVAIWLYDDRGYTAIDAAVTRIRTVLMGVQLAGSFELRPAGLADRLRDPGALKGAAMARYDWQIDSIVT